MKEKNQKQTKQDIKILLFICCYGRYWKTER